MEVLDNVAECGIFAAPPCRDRWHQEFFTEDLSAKSRQKGIERGALDEPATEGVGQSHRASANGVEEARHAKKRIIPPLEGIAIVVVNSTEDDVNLTKPFQGLDKHPTVSHGKVLALNQRTPQMPGKIRLLEIRLVERTRS